MKIILISLIIIILGTIFTGVYLYNSNKKIKKNTMKRALAVNIVLTVMALLSALAFPGTSFAASEVAAVAGGDKGLGLIAMALSTGLAAIGTGYAVGAVGSSAVGAVSEDPKILGKTLIFVGLAEGIAIYGLIISILILGRL